jgi:uroporphyrinogen decarboxylase
VLAELFKNGPLDKLVAGDEVAARYAGHPRADTLLTIHSFRNLGYDYATIRASDFKFPVGEHAQKNTISLNDAPVITDRASFEKYPWPELSMFPSKLADLKGLVPDGMKLIIIGPGGVLENAIRLVGYDNLCLMIYDDPKLVEEIFAAVGRRLVDYYREAVQHDIVGAVWANDDWGFKTQTMLAPADMRRFVVPWHKKIAEVAHAAGRPTIMHCCGRLDEVYDDIIDIIRHDGKHSYEDAIEPVEQAYERLSSRIAVIGGMDVDFVCRSTPAEVYRRARAMVERSAARGSYALGTGNSVPEYVPHANYFAMLAAANRERDDAWAEWADKL